MRIFYLMLLLAVAGCGGEYDGERPYSQYYPGGIYQGDLFVNDNAIVIGGDFANAIITQDGYAAISGGGYTIYGKLTMQGPYFDDFPLAYAWNGLTFNDGSTVKETRFYGKIENKDALFGTGLNASIIFDPKGNQITADDSDGAYELISIGNSVIDPSFSLYSGTYTDGSTTLTVSSDGSFTGQDLNGCAFNGRISIPAYEYNAVKLSNAVVTCGGTELAMEGNAARVFNETDGRWYFWVMGRYGSTGFDYFLAE